MQLRSRAVCLQDLYLHVADLFVLWPEVMAPLAHAVRLQHTIGKGI